METLEKLFGSAGKVKVMRLFIFNPDQFFNAKAVVLRTRLSSAQARKEITGLLKIKLIKSKGAAAKKVYYLNEAFNYLRPLRELMTHTIAVNYDDMIKRISRTCKLKSVVLSGMFVNMTESRVDMLIIGNQFNKDMLHKTVKKIESELGKELSYAILETEDFHYRRGVGDRLIRDVLEYPHEVAFDRIGLK